MKLNIILIVGALGLGLFSLTDLILRPPQLSGQFSGGRKVTANRTELVDTAHYDGGPTLRRTGAEPAQQRKAAAAPVTEPISRPEDQATSILARKAAFHDLAMRYDQGSLNILLSALQDSNREIRKAALNALVQFDDPKSIPQLDERARLTDDPEEKREILAAIDYLKLPSLHEYLAGFR